MTKSSGNIQTSLTLLRGEERGKAEEESNIQGRTEQQGGLEEMMEDIRSKCRQQGEQSRYSLLNGTWFKQHKRISLVICN